MDKLELENLAKIWKTAKKVSLIHYYVNHYVLFPYGWIIIQVIQKEPFFLLNSIGWLDNPFMSRMISVQSV